MEEFLKGNDQEFLESLGGWSRDRLSEIEGVTLAGLLMFGKERSLLEKLPRFHLDYQEHLSNDPEIRWTDRITIDGKWVPNLFNFYYRVYPRLVEDLDTPFKLDKTATRLEETHVHEALREALVNTLIHADYQTQRPIKIIKLQDVFIFSNPGRLRISLEQLYQGGVSDPRNPKLQTMFQMLGLGEKAGSGFQKILRAWKEQSWLFPLVKENLQLDMTVTSLPFVSMIPEEIEREVRSITGENYSSLDDLGRLILVAAHRFGEIRNKDIQHYCKEHPRDIGIRLSQYAESGWLVKDGQGSGTRYRWPNTEQQMPIFQGWFGDGITLPDHPSNSEHLGASSEHLGASSEHLGASSEHLNHESRSQLAIIRSSGKVPRELIETFILQLSTDKWLSLKQLAEQLSRNQIT
jgi:ATP-dependent DNA helicase RecG